MSSSSIIDSGGYPQSRTFEEDASITLYNKTWPLYTNCHAGGSASQRRAYIDLGEAAIASYQESVLKKYAKKQGASTGSQMLNTAGPQSAQATRNGTSNDFGCLVDAPGNVVPVLQRIFDDPRSGVLAVTYRSWHN